MGTSTLRDKTQRNANYRPSWRTFLKTPVHWFAFGFGLGLAPRAPGTFGTLLGIPLFLLLADLSLTSYIMTLAVLAAFGVWVCGASSRRLGVHDHGGIVWDEVVGYLVTMTALPATPGWLVAGFVVFRFFDIVKPWPIGWFDRKVHGGFGIMLDDIIAGLMGAAVLQAAVFALA
ncbi:MAG: phosphatidylglycerophosphatase A [Thiotrichales bacterium]